MAEEESTASDGDDAEAGAGNDEANTDEQTAETETTTESENWRDSIQDAKARKFADKFASPADAAASAFEARQKLSNAVSIPGKNASEEDIAEFHKKLGVPEKPDDYTVTTPDDLPEELQMDDAGKERLSGFLAAMHKNGATPGQVQTAIDFYYKMGADAVADQIKEMETARETATESLQKEWGKDYEANTAHAVRAAKAFGDEGFAEFYETKQVDGVPIGDHPEFLKVFASIGRKMGEGSVDFSLDDAGKASLEEQRSTLTTKIHEAVARGDSAGAKKFSAEREQISIKLYGDDPI